ncbi:MAG: type secretion system protein GspH [Pseudomonadota bacterium]|jgi:prepilin-type N-terminal cleavage/methylation domain-containing protein
MRKNGFTLIEILIVLVIVAVMSGIAVLSVGAPSYSGFMANANKIASTLDLLADQAIYTDSVISCDVLPTGFTCKSYKNGEWSDLNIQNIISWGWPPRMQVEKTLIDGSQLKEKQKIKFYPNGDISEMSFLVTDSVHHTWIDETPNGNFVVNN